MRKETSASRPHRGQFHLKSPEHSQPDGRYLWVGPESHDKRLHMHIHMHLHRVLLALTFSVRCVCLYAYRSTHQGVHTYMYIYIYMYTHMYVHIHIYVYTHMQICLFVYIYMCIYIYRDMSAPLTRPGRSWSTRKLQPWTAWRRPADLVLWLMGAPCGLLGPVGAHWVFLRNNNNHKYNEHKTDITIMIHNHENKGSYVGNMRSHSNSCRVLFGIYSRELGLAQLCLAVF